jgi:hypothetical protein
MLSPFQTNQMDQIDQMSSINAFDNINENFTLRIRDIQETWSQIASFFKQPELVAKLDDDSLRKLLGNLTDNGVLPLFERRIYEQGIYEMFSAYQKRKIAGPLLWHKANNVALWSTFHEVIEILSRSNLHPMPIKGTDFAVRYYEAPYLRPMVDIDLFFSDLSEAEKAYDLLLSKGYLCCEPTRGGDRWLWSRHLPEQRRPRDQHHIELHGALIFPPRDRRHQKERILLRELEELQYDSCPLKVLRPEAAVVFTTAHTFERHAADTPRLISLYDVLAVLKKQGSPFDWDRLQFLAQESGFSQTTAFGLTAAKKYLSAPVPDEVLTKLISFSPGRRAQVAHSRQTILSQKECIAFSQSLNTLTAFKRLLFMIFPSKDFMRYRYPNREHIPLLFLYPYRWWIQCFKLISFMAEKLRPA